MTFIWPPAHQGVKVPFPWSLSSLTDLLICENMHDEHKDHVKKDHGAFNQVLSYIFSQPAPMLKKKSHIERAHTLYPVDNPQ